MLSDAGLTIPAISTSRRSVMDPEHGEEYLAYSHRLLDEAAELGVPMVSFGFFQAFTPGPGEGAVVLAGATAGTTTSRPEARGRAAVADPRAGRARRRATASRSPWRCTRTPTSAPPTARSRFLEEVGHEACGLNPDIGNFVRLHRPLEPVPEMLDKLLPYTNYWHVKNYLRDEDPATGQVMTFPVPMDFGLINYRAAIAQALDLGFRGAFLCEHYGSDAITVIGQEPGLHPRHPRHAPRLTDRSTKEHQ